MNFSFVGIGMGFVLSKLSFMLDNSALSTIIDRSVGIFKFSNASEQVTSLPSHNQFVVSFINGIYHSEADWSRINSQLSTTFRCEVDPFYNPSTGNWAADFSSASMQLIAKPNDLDLAKNLSHHLKTLLRRVGNDGRLLHIAHSGGAILTYLAAKHHLTRHERDRMDVLTFGAGYSITRKYFSGRLVNYYARNDPLLFIDQRANYLRRLQTVWAAGPFHEAFESKHNTSYIFMPSFTQNLMTEHSMEGPTYRLALEREADIWTRKTLQLRAKIQQDQSLIRAFRKASSRVTGLHHFWRPLSLGTAAVASFALSAWDQRAVGLSRWLDQEPSLPALPLRICFISGRVS